MTDTAAHVRIDEGLKRPEKLSKEERLRIRQEARSRPLSTGKVWTHYDPQVRAQAILDVPKAILAGGIPKDVAEKYGIPLSTLHSWIIASDDAEVARGLMLASELMLRIEQIDTANDALELARAREGFRAWSWLAERREYRIYGQRQHIELETQPLSTVDKELLGSAQELLTLFKARIEREKAIAPAALPEKPLEST